jgi:cell wall-associated NlpC family hydrolase
MKMRLFVSILMFVALAMTGLAPVHAAPDNRGVKAVSQQQPVKGEAVVASALKFKGTPYKFGGDSPKAFDCSGFVWYVFKQQGITLPRTADRQFETGKALLVKELKPGDVVFFTTYEKGASHCGIYVGEGKFVHASSSHGVSVAALNDSYWKPRYLGARRMQ